jgi:hypothetical protein
MLGAVGSRRPREGEVRAMEPPVGEHNLGDFARWQLDAARRDPRLEHRRGAMVDDFGFAMEEAERVRFLSIAGLHELARIGEEASASTGPSGSTRSSTTPPALQAAWERGELARIEIENGYPHLNAQALLSMNSALDALVEEFVLAMREILVSAFADQALTRAESQQPDATSGLEPAACDRIREAVVGVLREALPKIPRLRESGVTRYERVLKEVGLAAPDDRPLPDELDKALTELGALRMSSCIGRGASISVPSTKPPRFLT